MITPCRLCGTPTGSLLVSERWAPASLLLASAAEPSPRFNLNLGQCQSCHLVQLMDPRPAPTGPLTPGVKPREPESHLDRLAERLSPAGRNVAGYSDKDSSLLGRLVRLGARTIGSADPLHPADLVVIRHRLEHEIDPVACLLRLSTCLVPGGLMVIEVPSCDGEFSSGDFSRLWDEHLQYFTAGTLRCCLDRAGMEQSWSWNTSADGEDLLVVAARACPNRTQVGIAGDVPADTAALVRSLTRARKEVPGRIAELSRGGCLTLLGTGHHGLSWVRLLGLMPAIRQVLDDHPGKQGRFVPDIPSAVEPTDQLGRYGPGLCLLAVRPDAEERIQAKHLAWTDSGGVFASISPSSPRYLLRTI